MSNAPTNPPLQAARSARTRAYTWHEIEGIVKAQYERNMSLRTIANETFKGRVTHATIQRILMGHEPTDPKIRWALGMQEKVVYLVIKGDYEIPRGTQVLSADRCPLCGSWFIPNVPNRKKCFECQPYTGKKGRKQ